MVCPKHSDNIGKGCCRLQVVVLRVSLLGQEPGSWLASLGDWAISKQEALQVEVTTNHDSHGKECITSEDAEILDSLEPKHVWAWHSRGVCRVDAFSDTELSIVVSRSSSNSFKAATPWAPVGELKVRLDQDVFQHLCTIVPGQSTFAFEAPWASFPLTYEARPTGNIELLFRLLPAANFDKKDLLDGIYSAGAPLQQLVGHSDAVLGAAIFGCGKRIVTVGGDKRGIIWDALSGSKLKELVGHTDWVQDCAVFPDGSKILTVSFDKTGIIWDAQTGAKQRELVGHVDWIKSCDVFPGGDKVVTVSFDKTGIIWDSNSGAKLNQLKGHEQWINTCAVSSRGDFVLTGSADKKGMIWSSTSGKKLVELIGHTDSIEGCAVFPGCLKVLTVARDRTGIIWDARHGQTLQVLVGHADSIQGCAVLPVGGPNDNPYWTDDEDNIVRDESSTERLRHARHNLPVLEKVITVSSDNTAIIWDAYSGDILQKLVGHKNLLHGCAVFPSGGKVLTASGDERGIIWDVRMAVNSRNALQLQSQR